VKETAARTGLRRPQSMLVQVECSYGSAIATVCDDVAFYTESSAEKAAS